jgi:hypothetical protein
MALAVSVFLHLLVLLFVRVELVDVITPRGQESMPQPGERVFPLIIAEGIPTYLPAEGSASTAPELTEPVPRVSAQRTARPAPVTAAPGTAVAPGTQAPVTGAAGTGRTAGAAGGEAAGATGSGRVPTVAERITPRMGDPRLFARIPDPLGRPMTAEEMARARYTAAIEALADSMLTAEERAARALDWTLKGKNGEKWGISPGKIHLGGVTLPMPSLGSSAAMRARMSNWNEIQSQASRADIKATLDDRIKAIRARRDAERDSTRRKAGGS